MKPQDLIHQFLRAGAALTLPPETGAGTCVVAAESRLAPMALLYYAVGTDYTGGVHRLEYDALRAPHALGVEFMRDGETVGYLCPVAEDGEESERAWEEWQLWLQDHENAEHHAASIAEIWPTRI